MPASNHIPDEDSHTVLIRIFPPSGQATAYPVELTVLGWRTFPRAALHVDRTALTALTADPRTYGLALGQALFGDQALGKAYGETLAAVHGQDHSLRVCLQIDPPELHDLHWERIYHPQEGRWRPLGSTASTPFSRYLPPRQWERPGPVTQRPLCVLAVIASPSNLDNYRLDPIADHERQALHAMLDALPEVTVDYLESGSGAPPTLDLLRRRLAWEPHLVHFLCHGARTPGGVVLYLERNDGHADPVEAGRLVDAFAAPHTPPVFCFLAACESAARAGKDGLGALGPALVTDRGVQAAVAMTAQVGLPTARRFAEQFYARLLYHGLVDRAVNEARAGVQDEWDWGVPVLFSRLDDGQLLDFPIGRIREHSLVHADRAFTLMDESLVTAPRQALGPQLRADLVALIRELGKSHGVLVEVADRYRRVGADPDTFAQAFTAFYYDFKQLHDNQTWVDEDTSCHEIERLSQKALPDIEPLMADEPEKFAQLRGQLGLLSSADWAVLEQFDRYLNAMDDAVEAIWAQVVDGNIAEAIRLKRDFEAQIGPSFRHSREMLRRMNRSAHEIG